MFNFISLKFAIYCLNYLSLKTVQFVTSIYSREKYNFSVMELLLAKCVRILSMDSSEQLQKFRTNVQCCVKYADCEIHGVYVEKSGEETRR